MSTLTYSMTGDVRLNGRILCTVELPLSRVGNFLQAEYTGRYTGVYDFVNLRIWEKNKVLAKYATVITNKYMQAGDTITLTVAEVE